MADRTIIDDESDRIRPSDEFLAALGDVLIPLRRFAMALCKEGQEADDLTQSTCERALARWTQFKTGTQMDSWVFSIMHSIWKNQIRKSQNRRRAYAQVASSTTHHDGEKIVLGKIGLSEVLSAMSVLNSDQRSALVLVCINGLSYEEAAKVLDIPQGTLESRVGRGRIKLGHLLSGEPTKAQKFPRLVNEKSRPVNG